MQMGGRPTCHVVGGYQGRNSRSGNLDHCLDHFLVQLELVPVSTRQCRESLQGWLQH